SSRIAVSSTASRPIAGGRPLRRLVDAPRTDGFDECSLDDFSDICFTCILTRMAHGTPTLATGKVCYLEIPAADVERSSRFYRDAFGWELRTRGDGAIAFDDAVKEVSG